MSDGSEPASAASISPASSRSSGSMNGRPRKAYASASVAKVRSSAASPVSGSPSSPIRRNPFSDSDQPWSRAIARSRTLCSLDPVKWIRYVPASPGGITMRSTCGPRMRRTAALCDPAFTMWSTVPSRVNRPIKRGRVIGLGEEIEVADRLAPPAERTRRLDADDARGWSRASR